MWESQDLDPSQLDICFQEAKIQVVEGKLKFVEGEGVEVLASFILFLRQ